jgi:hypothetical protein
VKIGGNRGTTPQKPAAAPNKKQIDYLKAHPEFADQFDAKFGKGASDQYIK